MSETEKKEGLKMEAAQTVKGLLGERINHPFIQGLFTGIVILNGKVITSYFKDVATNEKSVSLLEHIADYVNNGNLDLGWPVVIGLLFPVIVSIFDVFVLWVEAVFSNARTSVDQRFRRTHQGDLKARDQKIKTLQRDINTLVSRSQDVFEKVSEISVTSRKELGLIKGSIQNFNVNSVYKNYDNIVQNFDGLFLSVAMNAKALGDNLNGDSNPNIDNFKKFQNIKSVNDLKINKDEEKGEK